MMRWHFFFASWIEPAPADGVAYWVIDDSEDSADSCTAICGVPTWSVEAFA